MLFLRFIFPRGDSSWDRSALFNTDRVLELHGEGESNSLHPLPFGKKIESFFIKICSFEW
jgi:hypothetical protein